MADQIEVVYVDERSVACDGGGGALGHPLVFLSLGKDGRIACPYCGLLFIHDPARAGSSEIVAADRVPSASPGA